MALECLDEQPDIQAGDDYGYRPGQPFEPCGVDELAHFAAVAGEGDEREDGEAELHAEDDLAEDEQLCGAVFAIESDDDYRGNNCGETRDQSALPLGQTDVEKAFHDYLTGQGSGQGRVLAGGEKRDGEKDAGGSDAEQG